MKKLFIGLAFFGLLTFALPNKVSAEVQPCGTYIMTCCTGQQYYVVCCSAADFVVWDQIYCTGCN
jgi:hypothetical protein